MKQIPNYENLLVVTGTPKKVEKFRRAVSTRTTRLSLGKILPAPQNADENGSGWYARWRSLSPKETNWRIKHWGIANRDVDTRNWSYTGTPDDAHRCQITYAFDCKGTPNAWLKSIAPKFPKVMFELTSQETSYASYGDITETYLGMNGRVDVEYNKRSPNPKLRARTHQIILEEDHDYEYVPYKWAEAIKHRALFKSEDDL
jgi:hypothetical protein